MKNRIYLFVSIFILVTQLPCSAQVVLDGTLGRSGPVAGPDYAITSDLGRQVGSNLFHSFSQFSIYSGESATFSGPSAVQNIISRVDRKSVV